MNPNQEDGRAETRYDLGIYIHGAENVPRTEEIAQKVCAVGLTILLCASMFLFALAAINVIPLAVPIVASVFFSACAWMNLRESAKEI